MFKSLLALVAIIAFGTNGVRAQTEIPFHAQIKICDKYSEAQVHNCDHKKEIDAGEAEIIRLAAHINFEWKSGNRKYFPVFFIWKFVDEDGNAETITDHYEDSAFVIAPTQSVTVFEWAFFQRIWRDKKGRHVLVAYSVEGKPEDSEFSRAELEVK